jgi:hypothetical protein
MDIAPMPAEDSVVNKAVYKRTGDHDIHLETIFLR